MKQLFTQYLCVSGTLLNAGNIDINENKQTLPSECRVEMQIFTLQQLKYKFLLFAKIFATKNSLCLGDSEKAWERNDSELTFEK